MTSMTYHLKHIMQFKQNAWEYLYYSLKAQVQLLKYHYDMLNKTDLIPKADSIFLEDII